MQGRKTFAIYGNLLELGPGVATANEKVGVRFTLVRGNMCIEPAS